MPGQRLAFTQPIEMRINEMVSGVRTDLAVKLFGDDFPTLTAKANEIEQVLRSDPRQRRSGRRADHRPAGAANPDQAGRDRPLRRAGQGGARPGRIDRQQAAGRGGRRATALSAGRPPAGTIPRPARRPSAASWWPRRRASGFRCPGWRRSQVVEGPSTITREWGQRRITVTCNVRGRDLGSFVAEARQQSGRAGRSCPPGRYHIEWGGQFENLRAGPHPAADRRAAGASS